MGKSQQRENSKAIRNSVAIVILSIATFGYGMRLIRHLTASLEPVSKSEIPHPIQTRVVKLPLKAENSVLDKRITEIFDTNAHVKFPVGIEKLKTLFVALWLAESSFRTDAVGKAGEIGPLQITEAFWKDACEYSGATWGYRKNARSIFHSIWICWWYWERYCPEAVAANDWETLIRVHNGGPKGMQKSSTLPAWRKFQSALAELGGELPNEPRALETLGESESSRGLLAPTSPAGPPLEPEVDKDTKVESEWD